MNAEGIEPTQVPPRILTCDGAFIDDDWAALAPGDGAEDAQPALLPLDAYIARPQSAAHGVWLAPTDDPAALDAHLASVPLVAVQFPKFADGRGYSIAARLRRRVRERK